MNLVKVAALLHVLPLAAFATDCNFGSGCHFSCQCLDPDEVCDQLTGHCNRTGCKANLPNYTLSQSGWGGDGCQTGNVAYNKSAWQYYMFPGRVASRAVDGMVDRSGTGVSQPSRAGGGGAWWTVDLGALHTVYSVRMIAADLNGYFYLNHIRVYVSNSSIPDNNATLDNEADIMGYGDFVVCGEHPDTVPRGEDREVVCGQPLVGRYVLLWKYGKSTAVGDVQSSFITSEVTVTGHRYKDCTSCSTECNPTYGCIANCTAGKNQTTFCSTDCADGTFGVNCGRQCSGHCVNGAACVNTDGSCPGGCQLWYGNPICGTEIALPQDDIFDLLASPDVTSGSVKLTWDPLNSVPYGLESHYGYVIGQQTPRTQRADTDGEWRNIAWIPYTTNTGRVSYTVTGLAHNSQFSFRLQVYRQDQGQNETANDSKTVSVKTTCISPNSPAVRVQYFQMLYGDDVIDTANVTWDLIDPAGSGCDFIAGYVFTSFDQKGYDLDNTTSSYIVENNVTGTYVISVTAKNNGDLQADTRRDITIGLRDRKESSTTPPPPNTPLIAGLTVAIVALVTVVVVVLVLWRRRQRTPRGETGVHPPEAGPALGTTGSVNIAIANGTREEEAKKPSVDIKHVNDNEEDTSDGEDDQSAPEDALYENTAVVRKNIPLDLLEQIYREIKAKTKGFHDLYYSITTSVAVTTATAAKERNRIKNRFKNILPYDHSRVILATSTGDGYINASYVKGYGTAHEKSYVATQGPVPDSTTDFWEMVWQLKSSVVVMLTPLFENTKRKCDCYWPESVGQSEAYGVLTVTLREMEIYADYVRRKFILKTSQGTERSLEQFQYLAWPDKQRPLSTFALMGFLRVVRSVHKNEAPLIVHCSAGVGRTGTFIALDTLLRKAEACKQVNIEDCVRQLREQRDKMVQTQAQFEFLYEALIDYAKVGRTALSCEGFRESYAKLTMGGNAAMKRQFKTLRNLVAEQPAPELTNGANEVNLHKNRFPDILPDENKRPCLSSRSNTDNDYINAVFVKGFQKADSFIVTQAPLQQTKVDFWRLVYDFKISTIVMLNEGEATGLDAPCYWPQKDKLTLESFSITLKETTTQGHWVQREFDVKHDARLKSEALRVRQYQLTKWEDGRPGKEALNALLELQQAAMAYGQRHPTQPVLVHCLDGATRCGLFCALDHVIGATKSYGEVDVTLAARSIATSRREFIQDISQYVTLHDLVLEHLSKFATYANY